jgi:hypothetical protein
MTEQTSMVGKGKSRQICLRYELRKEFSPMLSRI